MWVIGRLVQAGHVGFFAGGCVRDMVLGRRPGDYDIATDATPQQVRGLFPRVLMVGAKFGVAMVIHKRRQVEVATFRTDYAYTDGRRPDSVRYATARQDALRRDFSINGMFYDPLKQQLIDYVGGRRDLALGVIRTIGKADDRFSEDYLRMLRAVRFAVRYDFSVEPRTAAAVRRHAGKITVISGERVFDELTKMLSVPSGPRALEQLAELGLAVHILPGLADSDSLWEVACHRAWAVAAKKDVALALGALLIDLPRETIRRLVRQWGAANDLRDTLCFLAEHRDRWKTAAAMSLADFKRLLAGRNWPHLKALWRVEEQLETGRTAQARRIARREKQIPVKSVSPAPLVTGRDLQRMGVTDGPRTGRVLRALYDAQLNERLTTRAAALKEARRMTEQAG